jgi:hypothetical protein
MRTRLVVLIAAVIGAGALADSSSPAQAWCNNSYSPCSNRAQYGYGYNYGYQYQQPYYQQQYYAQPSYQQQYYQQPAYRQPAYYQPPVYQQPAYQQPYYPQAGYAAPCCEPNWWEKLWGAKSCCQSGYAQTNYVAEPVKSDWSWSSNRDVQINNNGPVYVMREGVSVSGGFGPNYAYANPEPPAAETYVQPAPRYYRKRHHTYRHGPRVVVRTVYKTRVVYVRPKPKPHVLVPGNPSTSAGTYDVAPRKVLRP